MPLVTAIEAQAKAHGHRYNLFVDGGFAFSLAEDLAAKLSPGISITEAELDDLRRQDGLHKVYEAALRLLSYRPRSVAELRGRLVRRGFDSSLIQEALEKLESQTILDDTAFAQFWVENRQSYSPRGARLLGAELRYKGVDREVIEAVLPAPEDEESAAYRVAERKARSLKGADWQTFRQRLGDQLIRRGFDYETASTVVRRLWTELQEVP